MVSTADNAAAQRILNHPVHIVESTGQLSPSAFIPFCELGGDLSLLGRTVPGFDIPVCDKFEPRVVRGQICYRLEAGRYFKQLRREEGDDNTPPHLILVLDYNEERNINQHPEASHQHNDQSFVAGIVELQQAEKALIILETISKNISIKTKHFLSLSLLSSSAAAGRGRLRAGRAEGGGGDGVFPRDGPGSQAVSAGRLAHSSTGAQMLTFIKHPFFCYKDTERQEISLAGLLLLEALCVLIA